MSLSPVTENLIYKHDNYTVKFYGDYTAVVTWCQSTRIGGYEEEKVSKKGKVNSTKLDNNLSRAKAKVKEYALCNDWDYFCTFTLDSSKSDRYDLKEYIQKFGEFLHTYNRRCSESDRVMYLLIPEQHKDGAWHMHGLIKGIAQKDIVKNENGYLTWKQYNDKFGYMSLGPIRSVERISSYITKYITKSFGSTDVGINNHSYYCSKGLKVSEIVYSGRAEYSGGWDWEHPEGYCKKKTFDLRETELSEIFKMLPDEEFPDDLDDVFLDDPDPVLDPVPIAPVKPAPVRKSPLQLLADALKLDISDFVLLSDYDSLDCPFG